MSLHRRAVQYTIMCVFLQQLRAEIESKFAAGRFSWESVLPNDAAGLLKQLIRELPIPLLTFDYLDAFAQIDSTSSNQ